MFDGFDSFDTYKQGKHKSKWLDLFMGGRVGGHVSGGLSWGIQESSGKQSSLLKTAWLYLMVTEVSM